LPLTAENVAIVTGASSGIGRATAVALARKGLKLALLARSSRRLEKVEEEVSLAGSPDAIQLKCDVSDEGDVDRATATILDRWGRIDVLINSAGLSLNGPIEKYSLEDWRTVINTNLTGTFLMCRAVLPAMKRQSSGQIINVSSGAGRNGIAGMGAYCASKFGVIGFTETLGLEVRNNNVRVSVILPGSVATNFSAVANRGPQDGRDDHPIGYKMTAEEVAEVIVSMLEQPDQAWMSEVILRPLNLELRRSV
jgi:3-oxoacyl-[acyl-carrier protein] reductase